MSLVGNWQREAARFTPDLAVHVHHGADRLSGEELASALNAADLVITTYGLAVRDKEALSQIQWARVVCDEAQNIKNAATRQAQAVRALPAAIEDRADRHPGGEPPVRPVVDHGVHRPRAARAGGAVPHQVRGPDRAQRRRGGRGAAEADHRPVHPAPAEDR